MKNIGEFSVRGGILDVWSPTAEMPVRIEFFGDTVDSIREFDAETQLSIDQLKEISIAPMREFAATAKDFQDWAFFAREKIRRLKNIARALKTARSLPRRRRFFRLGISVSARSIRVSRAFLIFCTIAIFVVDEPTIVEQTLANFYETLENHFAEISEAGEIGLEPTELFLNGKRLARKI